jgi:DNA-binding response OmpR family regulator
MLRPSCPALVIHEDDAFRKSLIATLDQHHFTVTVATDGESAVAMLRGRKFRVVLLGLNLSTNNGLHSLEPLRAAKDGGDCSVIIIGEPNPELRTRVPWADETLLKPVDPTYVAKRANTYCNHA